MFFGSSFSRRRRAYRVTNNVLRISKFIQRTRKKVECYLDLLCGSACVSVLYECTCIAAQMAQFPGGFQPGGALPGFAPSAAAAANFSNFRPQYSVPGQPAATPSNVNIRYTNAARYRPHFILLIYSFLSSFLCTSELKKN